MGDSKKVLIVEDHDLVREGIVALLAGRPDLEVVAQAADGFAAMRMVREHRPDLVLMDLSMPEMDGIEATREIKRRIREARILVLTAANNERKVAEAIRSGADGYALKTSGGDELIAAIESVLSGERYLGEGISSEAVERYLSAGKEDPAALSVLTDRERQVLKLIAEGYKNREVAEKLFISPKTVETHRAKLMQKLDLHSAVELVTYALKHGIIEGV